MEHRFCVHPFKLALSLGCSLFFALMGGFMFPMGRWGSATIFLILAFIFGGVALLAGSMVHVSEKGLRRTTLGIKTKELSWAQVAEVGITGTKVFNQRHPEKTGSMFIYFSETHLTDEDRFNLMLKWPPMDKLYLLYTPQRFHAIQMLWDAKVETYNVGDLPL